MTSPSIDGSVVSQQAGRGGGLPLRSSTVNTLPGLTTTVANDLVVVVIALEGDDTAPNTTQRAVSTVTSANLTFTRRSQQQRATGLIDVEVWSARVSGTLSSEVITITLNGTCDAQCASAAAFQNVNSVRWDSNGSLPASANGVTSSSSATLSGISTSLADDLLLCVYSGTGLGTPTIPSGYTSLDGFTSFQGNGFSNLAWGYKSVSATQSSVSQVWGANGQNFVVAGDALTNDAAPGPTGTLAATEAKDTFAGAGGLLGGSMGATEAKDTFAGIALVPAKMVAVEAKDIFAVTGYPQLTGAMAATETKDAFAAAGIVTQPLLLDGSTTGGATGAGITSATATLTTTKANDVIVVAVVCGGNSLSRRGTVTSITDTAGLVWKRRQTRRAFFDQHAVEVWWAKAPALLTADVITVNTGAVDLIAIDAFGVSGANTNTPFDTHTGTGISRNSLQQGGTSFITGPVTAIPVYTNVPHVFSFGVLACVTAPTGTANAPYTYLNSIAESPIFMAVAYNTFDTQQFGTNQLDIGASGNGSNEHVVYLDNIVAAGESGTADAIRWFIDGQGNRTVVALAAGENSCTQVCTTYDANSVLCVAVLIQAAGLSGSPTVNHVTDTADPNSPHTWARRSRVTDITGNLVLELWYTQLGADTAGISFNGNVIPVCDNVAAGDIIGAITFAINGPSLFFRGELWDGDISLPATKHGDTPSFQTVGPFNTVNVDVLEIAIGANISTDLSNSGQLPFLQLSMPPSELASSSPPFNISLQFKFSGPAALAETASFNASPQPGHWLMLADAMPVGPPVPPQGVWASIEAKDFTGHTLDYTKIGIASPGGWVGFVPNHAAMAATDAKDKATNSGAFLPLFDSNGWVGFVPAHATLAVTDRKDTALGLVWVLGGPVVGRMGLREDVDRWSSSNRPAPITGTMALREAGDRQSSMAFLIPKAVPIPARKRRLLIVT